jgi:hypothetical protein
LCTTYSFYVGVHSIVFTFDVIVTQSVSLGTLLGAP